MNEQTVPVPAPTTSPDPAMNNAFTLVGDVFRFAKPHWKIITKIYSHYFLSSLVLYGIATVIAYVVASRAGLFETNGIAEFSEWFSQHGIVTLIPLGLVLIAVIVAGICLRYVAVIRMQAHFTHILKKETPAVLSFSEVLRGPILSVLLINVLVSLAVIGGMTVLIIPGIIVSTYLLVSRASFFFENKKGIDAMVRSWELTRGRFWAVFGRSILFSLIFFGIHFGISMATSLLQLPINITAHFFPLITILSMAIGLVSYILRDVIAMSLYVVFELLLYRDLVAIGPVPSPGQENSPRSSISVWIWVGIAVLCAIIAFATYFLIPILSGRF